MNTKLVVGATAGYLAAVNVGAAALFYYDKQQALHNGWRVKESTLQLSALLGGWAGGFWAMEKFRHKTKKQPFRNIYLGAVAGNVAVLGAGGYMLARKGNIPIQSILNSKLARDILKQAMRRGRKFR